MKYRLFQKDLLRKINGFTLKLKTEWEADEVICLIISFSSYSNGLNISSEKIYVSLWISEDFGWIVSFLTEDWDHNFD